MTNENMRRFHLCCYLHIGHRLLSVAAPLTQRKQKMCPQSSCTGWMEGWRQTAHSRGSEEGSSGKEEDSVFAEDDMVVLCFWCDENEAEFKLSLI